MIENAEDTTVMAEGAAEEFVVALLRERGPLTTMDIEIAAAGEKRRCPEQTVLFLSKMRMKGMIHGTVSIERRGWVWSLLDERPPSSH